MKLKRAQMIEIVTNFYFLIDIIRTFALNKIYRDKSEVKFSELYEVKFVVDMFSHQLRKRDSVFQNLIKNFVQKIQ